MPRYIPTSISSTHNRTLSILRDAEEGNYGVLAAICYNIEHLTAMVRAAESKRSPLILLLFPSTLKQLPTLAWAASAAIKSATVPLALHLDHAQDISQIEQVACTLPFNSIMVDMSHHEHNENLAKTKDLAERCHDNGQLLRQICCLPGHNSIYHQDHNGHEIKLGMPSGIQRSYTTGNAQDILR